LHAKGGAATGGPSRPGHAGSLYDVFSGGCVSYSFNRPRAVRPDWHFESAVGVYYRSQLRLTLKKELGVELDP
jgi:hypothetical protein